MKGFAIDMDGTVYIGNKAIQGAKEFISELKKMGVPYVFLTNNSSKGREEYYEKLKSMGFDVKIENVLTSGIATLMFLSKERKGKRVYIVGTESFVNDAKKFGIELDDQNPDIVLLSFDRELTYEKINKSYKFIKNGAEFIATHPDDLCPSEDGYDVDIGAFLAMYDKVLDVKPKIIGKPNRILLDMAAITMGIDLSDVIMVGDRLSTDIKIAQDCGIESILVLTGEAKREDLKNGKYKPTYVVESVAEIVPSILTRKK